MKEIATTRIAELATEIKDRIGNTRANIIEIGNRLIEAKKLLPHGGFESWLESEFQWTIRTAQNWMGIAGSPKNEIISLLNTSDTVKGRLAAPSLPAAVVDEIVNRVKAGEKIKVRDVAEAKERAKPKIPTATPNPELIEPDPDDTPAPLPPKEPTAADHRQAHNAAIEAALDHLDTDAKAIGIAIGHKLVNGQHKLSNPESSKFSTYVGTVGLLKDAAKALRGNLIIPNPEKPDEFVSALSANNIQNRLKRSK